MCVHSFIMLLCYVHKCFSLLTVGRSRQYLGNDLLCSSRFLDVFISRNKGGSDIFWTYINGTDIHRTCIKHKHQYREIFKPFA